MISAPDSRLPKALSAATLALVFALLLTLLSQALGLQAPEHRRPDALEPDLLGPRPRTDTIAGWRTRDATTARVVFKAQLDTLEHALDTLATSLDNSSAR